MTGFGHGEHRAGKIRYLVECTSVNRKQADIAVMLPREFSTLEPQVRELVGETFTRGRINVMITYEMGGHQQAVLDEAAAERTYASMQKLKKRLKLAGEITLDAILKAPGVMSSSESGPSKKEALSGILPALKLAMTQLKQMRAREGTHLKTELKKRLRNLRQFVAEMMKHAPQVSIR
ncbi:MAG: YicC/YloC family endoribonuclease, partial [Chthoniobacterales bacterium]